ncbi:alpha/beta hydrolase [Streptomyces sp. DSM 44915]|uniref:Alpha/beta hydrolase n=1 Tax=Streptomyces chisholmiae TaxID=3075540 RepID=A0ABU2JSL4_9ACTN|nr:alpha/beta hydrolase [Streptomyces sp. DSM 44915]MDT0267990.1 alpha/beta hydrolase [Streptomyces sp. DSM 44915]
MKLFEWLTGRCKKSQEPKPTIVLVHGAFEDAGAWSGVTGRLQRCGYRVVAPPVPLRGVAADVAYLDSAIKALDGPVVLAGHSYGGVLVTELAARNAEKVRALVYVAAFIPDAGETVNALNAEFPGSLLGPETTYTVDHAGGSDMYAKPESYKQLLADDRSSRAVAVTAAGQRPIDTAALTEQTTAGAPAEIPKFAIVATRDNAVPTQAQQHQAERARAEVSRVRASHDVPTSHPAFVARVIKTAIRQSEKGARGLGDE